MMMRRASLLLMFLAAILPLCGIAQAQKSKGALQTEINTNFPDNTLGTITPFLARSTFFDMLNSWQQYAGVNSQTGTSYTFLTTDYGQLVIFNNASPVAVTLPQAIGAFGTWNTFVQNTGAGTVTITPTISTINGASSYALSQGGGVYIVSDGANYRVWQPNIFPSIASNTVLGNSTASTAGPTGLAMPSCATSGLTWTTNTGFGCNSVLTTIPADNLLGNPSSSPAAVAAIPLPNSPSCSSAQNALTYNTSTHTFGCNTIAGGGTVLSGTAGQLGYYSGSTNVIGGNANATMSTGVLTLGINSGSTGGPVVGGLVLEGSSTGAATIQPTSGAAGTPTLTIGTSSGTIVATAASPLSVNSGTGQVSITGVAGQVLNGSPAAFTATPILGANGGTTGEVVLTGSTSGNVGVTVANAAGNWVLTLPTNAGSSGQFLETNGLGVASWASPTGSGTVASGSTGQMAYYSGSPNNTTVSGNSNASISAGALTLGQAGTTIGQLVLSGNTSGTTTITPNATASGTMTVPAATDTLVGRATTDTLTNKTINGSSNTLTVLAGSQLSGTVPLANGGLGGSQASATANQIPVFPGSSGAAVPTSAATWLTNVGALVDTSSLFFASGQPWCDVVAKGAVGDSVTSDVAAFNACFTELSGGSFAGGTVYVPPTAGNTYCLPGGITIPAFVQLVMTGWETSLIACGNNAAPVVTLSSRSAIRYGTIQGYGLRVTDTGSSASQPALSLPSSATGAIVDSMQVLGGTGVNWACGECYARFNNFSESYGIAQVYVTGGGNLERTSMDGAGAVLQFPYTLNAWTSTACTAPAPGIPASFATVSAGAWVLECHTSSATAGVANPPVPNWGITVVDGPHYTTNSTTAAGTTVLHFASTTGISDGQFVYDISHPGSIYSATGNETTVASHTSTTVTLTCATAGNPSCQPVVSNIASSETIAIGGQTWILFAPATYHALLLDAGTSQFLVHDSDLSGPYSSSLEMLNSSPQYTTNGTTSAGTAVLNFASTTGVVNGQFVYDFTNPGSIANGTTVSSHTGTTVTMSANAVHNIGSSENIAIGTNPSPTQFICIECVFTPTFFYGLELRAGGNVYISGGSQIAGGGVAGGVGVLTTSIYFGPTQITNSNITGPSQYGIQHSGPSSGFYVTNTVVGSTSGGYTVYLDSKTSEFQMRGGKIFGSGGGVAIISGSDYNEITGVDFSAISGTLISLGAPVSSHNLITNNVAVPPTVGPGVGLSTSGASHTSGPSPEMHNFVGDITSITVNGTAVCFAACQWLMPPNATWVVNFGTAANDYPQIMQ